MYDDLKKELNKDKDVILELNHLLETKPRFKQIMDSLPSTFDMPKYKEEIISIIGEEKYNKFFNILAKTSRNIDKLFTFDNTDLHGNRRLSIEMKFGGN